MMMMMPFVKSLAFIKFHRLKNYSEEELQKKIEMEKENGGGKSERMGERKRE